jgi:thioredoxin 1
MNETINETMNKIMNQNTQINQEDLARSTGPLMLEFGAGWCSYCQAAQSLIATALLDYQHVQHIRIEDGKGQRLGRSYTVKLWPTLVFLKDGMERSRLVRPQSAQAIAAALHDISSS